MAFQLPPPPDTGIIRDVHGLSWRRTSDDMWRPDDCPTCGTCLSPMTWAALLESRGPLIE